MLEVVLAGVVALESLVEDGLQVGQQLPQLLLQPALGQQPLLVEGELVPAVGRAAEERFELLGELGEAGPEYVDEGVGADDGDGAELVDCAGVLDLAGQVGEVLAGGLGLLAVSDGLVPGQQQVDRFLVG